MQRLVARGLTIRRCPEIRFVLDDSLKTAAETVRAIDETMRADHPEEAETTAQTEPDDGASFQGGTE